MANSRYTEPLIRVLSAYPPGSPGLMTALEAICQTAEENGFRKARDRVAEDACEGLHLGPAKGVKCLMCYHAEHNFAAEEQVRAEIEASKEERGE